MSLVEQLPEYAELMRETIAELEPAIRQKTGDAAAASVPVHLLARHARAVRLRRRVQRAVPDRRDQGLSALPSGRTVDHRRSERALPPHGDNLLQWRDSFADEGARIALAPGDALFVLYRWPHWVDGGRRAVGLAVVHLEFARGLRAERRLPPQRLAAPVRALARVARAAAGAFGSALGGLACAEPASVLGRSAALGIAGCLTKRPRCPVSARRFRL